MHTAFQIIERTCINKRRNSYSYCAVVEVDPERLAALGRVEPAQISPRGLGVVRILWASEPYPTHGTTPASRRRIALAYAAKLKRQAEAS